jgi:hypothetical protein
MVKNTLNTIYFQTIKEIQGHKRNTFTISIFIEMRLNIILILNQLHNKKEVYYDFVFMVLFHLTFLTGS